MAENGMQLQEMEDKEEAQPLTTTNEKISKPTFKEKIGKFTRNITIEPACLMFLSSSILAAIATQTLNLDKACRVNLNLGDEICDALRRKDSENYTEYEKMVQEYIAPRLSWRGAIQSLVPCLIIPFIGHWSDVTGRRKLLVMLPLTGEILQCISNTISVFFFYQLPVEVLMFFDVFFPAVGGGWTVMFIGAFSYITDITSVETRTHRMGLVSFCTYVGIPIGLGLSGVVLKYSNYYGVYLLSATIHVINFMFLTFILKDPPRSAEQMEHDGKGTVHFLRTFFDFKNVKQTFAVVFGGSKSRRTRICILLIVVTLLFGPFYGEISIMYMSTRNRFNWDEVKFSLFQTYNFITHTIGTLFSITVFSKCLKWHDSVLGIISTVSKIAASFVYCFATTSKIFYIGPVVEILNGTSLLALRSITSKLVSSDELGKVNSIFSLTENLMPLVYVPLYTTIYIATFDTLPGAVFLFGASLTLPAVIVFIYLFVEYRRSLRMKQKEVKNMTE